MKRTTFLLFFISPLCLSPVLAQSPDLPLFEDEAVTQPAQPCPTCAKPKKTTPNVGQNAQSVDSIHFAPAPFPSVKVTMQGDEPLPSKPFEGVNMLYESSYSASKTNAYADRLSQPVDFNAEAIAKLPQKAIVETNQATENAAIKPVPTAQNAASKEVPSKSVNVAPAQMPTAMPVPRSAAGYAAVNPVNFDIAGLLLKMQPEDVIETAEENGFEITNVAYGIPSFMVTDFERACRADGLYQTRLIHECVRERARDEDVYYISQLKLTKPETKEQIIVLFSSTLTDNQAFKIDYTGFGDNSLSTSYKDLLKKTNRRDVFWKYINDKYGQPANGNALYWGNANGISMRAFLEGNAMDARIVLQDATQQGADYKQAQSWNKEQEVQNPFSF